MLLVVLVFRVHESHAVTFHVFGRAICQHFFSGRFPRVKERAKSRHYFNSSARPHPVARTVTSSFGRGSCSWWPRPVRSRRQRLFIIVISASTTSHRPARLSLNPCNRAINTPLLDRTSGLRCLFCRGKFNVTDTEIAWKLEVVLTALSRLVRAKEQLLQPSAWRHPSRKT